MNTELTDLLRAGMERVPAQIPPGLAGTAYRRYRRNRARARAVTAASTAAITGTAAAISLAAAPGGAALPRPVSAAYVAGRVAHALDDSNLILASRGTQSVSLAMDRTSYFESWSYQETTRSETLTPAGQVLRDQGFVATSATRTLTQVDYQRKTWFVLTSQGAGNGSGLRTYDPGAVLASDDPQQMAAQLRALVSSGVLKAGQTEVVDGVEAIALTGASSRYTDTYWVSTSTYLPVRVMHTLITSSGHEDKSVADLRWLPPTPANLASLTVPIPAGFTQVSPAAAGY